METAVPSNDIIRTFKKIEDTTLQPTTVAEKSDAEIGQLANDPRWLAFKEVIGDMIQKYERDINIEVTDSPEQVGFKYLNARLTAGALKAVRDLPDAIAKGIDGESGTTGE